MTKHVAETLDALPGILTDGEGANLADHLRAWTATQGDKAETALKLGGKFHSDKEKARRVKLRACILCALAFRKRTYATVDVYATGLENQTDTQLIGELRDYLKCCAQREGARLVFGSSFRNSPATGALREQCRSGYELSFTYLEAALKDLMTVTAAKGEPYERFKSFFGDFKQETVDAVVRNLTTILIALRTRTLWLYFRGKAVGTFTQDNDWPFLLGDFQVGTKLAIGHHFGATLRPSQQGHGWNGPNPLQSKNDLHVMVGTLSEGAESKVVGGMLIHELSHYLCDTRDVKIPLIAHPFVNTPHVENNLDLALKVLNNQDGYFLKKPDGSRQLVTRQEWVADKRKDLPQRQFGRRQIDDAYGADTCKALAATRPEKALVNADNYALYCLQFAA